MDQAASVLAVENNVRSLIFVYLLNNIKTNQNKTFLFPSALLTYSFFLIYYFLVGFND